MLVISRKPDESISIGPVRVVVLGIEGKRVTLGVEAPMDMRVLRWPK